MSQSKEMNRKQEHRSGKAEKRATQAKLWWPRRFGIVLFLLWIAVVRCYCFVSTHPSRFPRTRIFSTANSNNDDEMLSSSLSERIRLLQEKEATQENRLSMRIKGLQKAQELQEIVESSDEVEQVELPVVSFDSLLPKQRLEGRTDDPTFCRFLQKVGLGGWFVMTSLDARKRKLRRHGVLAKIEAMDDGAIYHTEGEQEQSNSEWIPSAVDFCISGHSRCRIVGPRQGMEARSGRWRRGYDPNGEESVLGWGHEKFVDAPEELALHDASLVTGDEDTRLSCTEWNSVLVECNLEAAKLDVAEDERDKMNELVSLVEEWYVLASSTTTYTNTNVTAATRVKRGHPGLWVDPEKLLQQVAKELGPRPEDDPTAFSFWAAALINPLPVLGVSMEIRGRLLEAPTTKERLRVLEFGLQRSIDNLTGKRPL